MAKSRSKLGLTGTELAKARPENPAVSSEQTRWQPLTAALSIVKTCYMDKPRGSLC